MYLHEMPKSCKPSKLAYKYLHKKPHFIYHILYGLESKIPICCITAFVIRSIRFGKKAISPCYNDDSCHAEFSHYWFCRRKEHLHIVPRYTQGFDDCKYYVSNIRNI